MSVRISIILPDMRPGGAERVTVNLANTLAQREFLVDMVLLTASGVLLDALSPDIRVVDLRVKRMRNLLTPLTEYLRETQPAALLACMWPITATALWAAKLARVDTRVVVAEHTTWSRAEICKSLFTRWQVKTSMYFTFPFVNGVVAVSQGAADDLASFANLDRNTITVIYNPVVGEAKPASPSPLQPLGWWSGSHHRVLAVGTLKAIKDYATLLNAFALLVANVDARLLILGEGECRAALEQQARELGISDKVFMPGFTSEPAYYYQQADLFVLSSTGEGLPTVMIEALAAGTPVVSTDCPSGPREILSDGQFGVLVPVGDAQALATAMATSLTSTHDIEALKTRAQDFAIDKAVDQYETMLFPHSPVKALS